MSVLVLDNVQYLDEWHEHVLTDFINYYGEPSNQIEEFNKILSNYNIDSNSKTTYNHKILLRKYRIKYHEFLKRIIYSLEKEAPKKTHFPYSPDPEKRKLVTSPAPEIIKPDIISEQSKPLNMPQEEVHPEKKIYRIRYTFGQAIAFIGVVGSVLYFLGQLIYSSGVTNGRIDSKDEIIELNEINKDLNNFIESDTLGNADKIVQLKHLADSAHKVLGNLKYDTLPLSSAQKRDIQTAMENVGYVLEYAKALK